MPEATPAAPVAAPAAPAPAAPAPAAALPAPVVAPAPAPAAPAAPAEGASLLTPSTTKDGKAAEPQAQDAPKPAAPPPLEVKFPEGFKTNEASITGFKAVAAELGLKSEGAQKLADWYVKTEQARDTAFQADVTGWAEAAKADAEYGGAKFGENLAAAQKAVEKFASPALTQLLKVSGLGNHPEVVRLFVKLGHADAEDSVAGAGGGAVARGDPQEALRREMFPSAYQK